MVGDGHRVGTASKRVGGVPHLGQLLALEPTGVLEFGRIDNDVLAECLADQPDHQARGKGPGLAGDIADIADPDARFLEDFAPGGLFDGLARLHEARKCRIHARRPACLPPKQETARRSHHHDDNRIGAREMIALAGTAMAAITAIDHMGSGAAIGAIAMSQMPVDERSCLGEQSKLGRRHGPFNRDAAQVSPFVSCILGANCKPRAMFAVMAEEDRILVCARLTNGRMSMGKTHFVTAYLDRNRSCVASLRGNPAGIRPFHCAAIEGADTEAKLIDLRPRGFWQ